MCSEVTEIELVNVNASWSTKCFHIYYLIWSSVNTTE